MKSQGMQAKIEQLKKLGRMGWREIRERSRQEISKLGERALRAGMAEMSDDALRRELTSSAFSGDGSDASKSIVEIADQIRASTLTVGPAHWFPSFGFRREIVETMESRFAVERRSIIDRADRACRGRFDLLGLTDLSFGQPIDWHLDATSGKRTGLDHWSRMTDLEHEVAGDDKVTCELNRHQHFVTFGQAWWLTGDEGYVKAFVDQASDWMDANPPKRGINWTSSLELAFRAISWLWAWRLCADSPALTATFISRLLKSLIAQGRHIESYLSRYSSPNTHLTGEALGLLYLGVALPGLRRAPHWRDLGLRLLLEQLPVHVRSDGVYFEQSSYYHRYTADFYTHLLLLIRAREGQLHDGIAERLTLLHEHLMWITRPDGSSPFFGDDDGGRLIKLGDRAPADFRDTLATGAALFGRGDWKSVAGEAASETLWLLGPQGLADYDRLKPEPPGEHARAFGEGGYFVMRDGWAPGSSYTLVDCGPHGAPFGGGHAHADALAIEFAAAGVTWLLDPGTFNYTGDPQARDEFRSTAAHNTVTVDDEWQSIPGRPFAWRRSANCIPQTFIAQAGFSYFEGAHDGYQRLDDPVIHTRSVFFIEADGESDLPTYLVVRDCLHARKRHRYAIHYHFPEGCEAEVDERGVRVTQRGGARLVVRTHGSVGVKARVRASWVSRGYGHRAPAPVAVIEAEGVGPQEFVSIIAPENREQAVGAEFHSISAQASGFVLTAGATRDVVSLGSDGARISFPPVEATGALAYVRFVNGRLTRAGLIRGNCLKTGGLSLNSPEAVESFALRLVQSRAFVSVQGTGPYDLTLPETVKEVVAGGVGDSRSEIQAAR
jgi:hypothetical protein